MYRQKQLADPLIDLKLFRVPAFSASLAVYTLGILVLFGAFLFIFQYLQLVAGLSPFRAGLWTLPSFGAFMLGSMLAPAIVRRVPHAYVMAAGLAIAAAGFAVMTQVEVDSGLAVLVAATVIFSLGLAPLFTLANDLIIGTAPPERAGAASAISETGAELGGALSIALIGTLGTAVYRSQVEDGIPARVPPEAAETARDTLGGAVAVSEELPDASRDRTPRRGSGGVHARPPGRGLRECRHRGSDCRGRGDLDAERAAGNRPRRACADGRAPGSAACHRARVVLTTRSQTAAITRACAAASCLSLALALAAATVVSAGSAGAGPAPGKPAEPMPVASLEPEKTNELWRRLVASPRPVQLQADCRPLRGVFYAATDFLRLATKLAATPSPCAEYYISVPPLVSDKTLPRPNAAPRIRALGPNFHAMAEIHFATWTRWVASTGSSWHTAGVTARQRMAAVGFDVAQGDTWVFNELTTAVRRGTGSARANVREFLRGLYEGDGTRPTRGAVFVIGFGQRSTDVSLYQTNLQNWLADSAFWTDMNTYVSDWTQEAYGDVRSWAVPGVPTSVRRESLNDYLQHKLVLAGAGPVGDRDRALLSPGDLQPARERGLGAGHRLWLDDGSGAADGRVRLRAGSRPSPLQRDDRAVSRSLGIRVGAEERSRHPGRRVRRADRRDPRPARGGGA